MNSESPQPHWGNPSPEEIDHWATVRRALRIIDWFFASLFLLLVSAILVAGWLR